MYTFKQSTGEFFDNSMKLMDTGYAGNGQGKNNPDMEGWVNIGCLPTGLYSIGKGIDRPNTGILSLPLTPRNSSDMYGRGSFYIHGDNGLGTASEGCVVVNHDTREKIDLGTDKLLNVVR